MNNCYDKAIISSLKNHGLFGGNFYNENFFIFDNVEISILINENQSYFDINESISDLIEDIQIKVDNCNLLTPYLDKGYEIVYNTPELKFDFSKGVNFHISKNMALKKENNLVEFKNYNKYIDYDYIRLLNFIESFSIELADSEHLDYIYLDNLAKIHSYDVEFAAMDNMLVYLITDKSSNKELGTDILFAFGELI